MPVREEVLDLQRSLAGREARDVIAAIVKDDFRGRVAVACSFGTEAAAAKATEPVLQDEPSVMHAGEDSLADEDSAAYQASHGGLILLTGHE